MADDIRPLVLVVEDQVLILEYAIAFIEDAGYAVIAASKADQAVALLESRSDIRVVFSDNDMPGSMNGLKLAAAVRDRWPPIELILTSGNGIPADRLPARALFFRKPYSLGEIVQAIDAFMAQTAT